jgi:hypothetical protein
MTTTKTEAAKTPNPDIITLSNGKEVNMREQTTVEGNSTLLRTLLDDSPLVDCTTITEWWKNDYTAAKTAFDKTSLKSDYETARDAVLADFAKTAIAQKYQAAETARDRSKSLHDQYVRMGQKSFRKDMESFETIENRGRKGS